jgi:hypothetical protein
LGGDTLQPIGGPCGGLAMVKILNPEDVVAHSYEVTFIEDSVFHVPESVWVDTTTFNLFDVTAQETLLVNHELSDSSLDNIPVVDGFRLTLFNCGSGIKSMGWTLVQSDTCTFEWWTGYLGGMAGETYIYGAPDFRVVVDSGAHSIFSVHDGFGGDTLTIEMPIRVLDITDSLNAIDVSQYCWLLDYAFSDVFPNETLYFGPEGWDLIPGGAGYNPNLEWLQFADQIGCYNDDESTATGVVYFATQNGPDTARPPSEGDEFTIRTYKQFSSKVKYQFTMSPPSIDTTAINLSAVRVVPNPYILHSRFENTPYDRRLMFTNLPQMCEIQIYNIAGEHINTIKHKNNLSYEYWDLRTKYGLEVAYGLYIYVVKTADKTKAKGKFVIIK